MIVYVDTSAALKLLVQEQESDAVGTYLEGIRASGWRLVSSLLMHTELHCAANRRPEQVEHAAVADVLSAFDLLHLDAGDLTTAAALPGGLRALDALHLASALRVGADALLVYDHELAAAAAAAGVRVVSSSAGDAVG